MNRAVAVFEKVEPFQVEALMGALKVIANTLEINIGWVDFTFEEDKEKAPEVSPEGQLAFPLGSLEKFDATTND